jgi:anti-sigma B factor antagonist
MVSHHDRHCLAAEQVGDVTLVTIRRREVLDEGTIGAIDAQLTSLVNDQARHQLVLNFDAVRKLSAMMLLKLVLLDKKVRASGGRLALCRLDPKLCDIFGLLSVGRRMTIYREEQDALQAF